MRLCLPECGVCCEPRDFYVWCEACARVACGVCYDQYLPVDLLEAGRCMFCKEVMDLVRLYNLFGEDWISERVTRAVGNLTDSLEKTVIAGMRAQLSQTAIYASLISRQFPFLSIAVQKKMVTKMIGQGSFQCPHEGCAAYAVVVSADSAVCEQLHESCWKCRAAIPSGPPPSDGPERPGPLERVAGGDPPPSGPSEGSGPSGIAGGNTLHRCDPAALASIELIRGEAKPCPNCAALTYRVSGCDDMYCVVCTAKWNWRTGATSRGGHNPHEPLTNRRRDPGDVPGIGAPQHPHRSDVTARMLWRTYDTICHLRRQIPGRSQGFSGPNDRYVRGTISREKWVRQVLSAYRQELSYIAQADLVERLFLGTLAVLRQGQAPDAEARAASLVIELNELADSVRELAGLKPVPFLNPVGGVGGVKLRFEVNV